MTSHHLQLALAFTLGMAIGLTISVILAMNVLQMDMTYPATLPWTVWA